MKNAVFWDVTPCGFIIKKKTTRRHIPEDSILQRLTKVTHYVTMRENYSLSHTTDISNIMQS
jgi:hypothetical protein